MSLNKLRFSLTLLLFGLLFYFPIKTLAVSCGDPGTDGLCGSSGGCSDSTYQCQNGTCYTGENSCSSPCVAPAVCMGTTVFGSCDTAGYTKADTGKCYPMNNACCVRTINTCDLFKKDGCGEAGGCVLDYYKCVCSSSGSCACEDSSGDGEGSCGENPACVAVPGECNVSGDCCRGYCDRGYCACSQENIGCSVAKDGAGKQGDPCCNGLICSGGKCIIGVPPIVDPDPAKPGDMIYRGPIIDDLNKIVGPITRILYFGGLFIGIAFIIYSGYGLMMSGGDPQKTKIAQEQLTAAIVGIMFILLSAALLRVIINNVIGGNINI